jgi:hypothetical protein
MRIAVSSSGRNNMVAIGGVVRLPLSIRGGPKDETSPSYFSGLFRPDDSLVWTPCILTSDLMININGAVDNG